MFIVEKLASGKNEGKIHTTVTTQIITIIYLEHFFFLYTYTYMYLVVEFHTLILLQKAP